MPIAELYLDYGIDTAPEGHKHYREGWVNIACPHCTGSEGYHLGFNSDGGYYYCWRCGNHSVPGTLSKLLQVSFKQANQIARDYRIFSGRGRSNTSHLIKIGRRAYKRPSGVIKLWTPHNRYLRKRNFDPGYLADEWGVMGTSPGSKLDGIPYAYRIFIPITWDGKEVTFQCRDYSGKQDQKYMACPQERELVHHKHILYGNQEKWKKVGVIVEGALDVWRLKGQAAATLGIGYTKEQVRLIVDIFEKVFIIFDQDSQAQEQAKKLRWELRFRGLEAYNYTELETDPGDLTSQEADYLLNQLGL